MQLTPEQEEQLTQPTAMEQYQAPDELDIGPFWLTERFHQALGLPNPSTLQQPSVSDRERRLRLILEELLELAEAMGFEIVVHPVWNEGSKFWVALEHDDDGPREGKIGVRHIEGSRYDVVETADALGDLNVVVNGTAVEFGIPLPLVDLEIFASNMTKLGPDGKPIINGVTPGYRDALTIADPAYTYAAESGFRPDVPVGKVLKPDSFVKANIAKVLKTWHETPNEEGIES